MRVLTLTTIYPNEIRESEGKSVASLEKALSDLDIKGTTLVLRPWAPVWLAKNIKRWHHLAVTNRRTEVAGNVVFFDRYIHIPKHYRLDISAECMANRAKRLIEKHGVQFDLIHGQSIFPAALAASRLASEYGVPFIITLRDDLEHLDHMLDKGGLKLRCQYKKMFEKVSAILVHGPGLLKNISRFLPEGKTIPVLMAPNGVDMQEIERILASLEVPSSHAWGRIISVGNLYRFKGIHENLLAFKVLIDRGIKEWTYTIVGDGPYMDKLRYLSRELGLAEKVFFAGRLDRRGVISYICGSDIFSLPSWAEPFGNVYAESAFCGKPVIGCWGQGAEITVKHGETGLLIPTKDVSALADALEYLLLHPEEAKEMGRRGKENIRQFTWEKTAQIYRGVMEEVLTSYQQTHKSAKQLR